MQKRWQWTRVAMHGSIVQQPLRDKKSTWNTYIAGMNAGDYEHHLAKLQPGQVKVYMVPQSVDEGFFENFYLDQEFQIHMLDQNGTERCSATWWSRWTKSCPNRPSKWPAIQHVDNAVRSSLEIDVF